MKYMTFNSSCSYAGLANLLAFYDVNTSDREIALEMGLPYLFANREGRYLAGPMLQSKEWFALYLKPRGFVLTEREMAREQVCGYLQSVEQAMLGLRVTPKAKHAVVYVGREGERYRFLNNKWEKSEEPDTLLLSEEELLERLDERVVVAVLEKVEQEETDRNGLLLDSVETLKQLKQDIVEFSSVEHTPGELKEAMETMFRAILLDGITMLELLDETAILQKLKTVQGQLLQAVRENWEVRLNRALDLGLLQEGIRDYEELIQSQIM